MVLSHEKALSVQQISAKEAVEKEVKLCDEKLKILREEHQAALKNLRKNS